MYELFYPDNKYVYHVLYQFSFEDTIFLKKIILVYQFHFSNYPIKLITMNVRNDNYFEIVFLEVM